MTKKIPTFAPSQVSSNQFDEKKYEKKYEVSEQCSGT
jgi:hypothetical protein